MHIDAQLLAICLLTAAINLIGTLAYAARIAGVRTRRIAMSFALFNILVLVSRTSNGFLGPFLAKRIETQLSAGGGEALLGDFRLVLLSASVAVTAGVLLVPTGQRLFARAIGYFQRSRSTGKMLLRSASPAGLRTIRQAIALPRPGQLRELAKPRGVGWGVLLANRLAQALITVGVLASLYAGYLNPQVPHHRLAAFGGRQWLRHHSAVRADRPAAFGHDRRRGGRASRRAAVPPHDRVDIVEPLGRHDPGASSAVAGRGGGGVDRQLRVSYLQKVAMQPSGGVRDWPWQAR